ncbi:Spy/CpxP family protein refolding chaperone [Leptothrix discophora]|uniref:Spy/CpxP family protein refolding chaperone n=1 Tax=Leptothrix discophora TaxID=89 RepID=A0ABT9FYN9_LEPDI|nr:Spy/CpxP family protein refolding chaperone [Leptothrix discophora]MDP4299261.1 Spy/CpxP family protein refolding chaperone [Leptothrix discophora]
MKTWKQRSLTVLATTALSFGLLGGVGAVLAAPMGGEHMMGMMGGHGGMGHHGPMSDADHQKMRERMLERATNRLKLDEAQKQRLGKLMDALHAQHQALQPEGAAAPKAGDAKPAGPRDEWQALIAGNRFDKARAQQLADAKAQAIQKSSPAVIAAAADFFDNLKPEQQTQVREYLARGAGRGGHDGHRGMHGGRGDDRGDRGTPPAGAKGG